MAVNTDRRLVEIMRRIARLEQQGNFGEAAMLRNVLRHPQVQRTYTPNIKKLVVKS